MGKKVLLVDVDSTIPNLALMKVSAYHKSIGDTVGFDTMYNPDLIYASVIFRKNKHKCDNLSFLFPDASIDYGGPGYDLTKTLPIPDDLIMPDYDLYPGMDYDLGFTTRGCIRNCYFCIVRQKEGKFHRVQHPSEFHKEGHKKAVYLDNNILADKEWFFEVTDWLIENHMAVDFKSGLDVRLMDVEIAQRLKLLKFYKPMKFAYDDIQYTEAVSQGVTILKEAGISLRGLLFYVYIHDDSCFDDALLRCRRLKEWGASAFPMINLEAPRTQRMTDLKRWCIPWIYWTCDFEEYQRSWKSGQVHKKPVGGFL